MEPEPQPPREVAPAPLEPGSSQWDAIAEQVRRVESAYEVKFDALHKRLDDLGMQGRPFGEILDAVARTTPIPEFYAGMVVLSYPGFETDSPQAAQLRTYLARRKQR